MRHRLWALPAEDGFVIPLTYGVVADWLKNVLASGSAVIIHDGHAHHVDHPETVPFAVAVSYVPPVELRILRLYAVDTVLHVRTAASPDDNDSASGPAPTPAGA